MPDEANKTAEIYHNSSNYLVWMIGEKTGKTPQWLFQNTDTTSNAKFDMTNMPDSLDLILVPKIGYYGPNNDTPINMNNDIFKNMWHRNLVYVSGFRPSPQGSDTTYIFQFTTNLDDGSQISQTNIDRVNTQVQSFLYATKWPNKDLLKYYYTKIGAIQDPLFQYVIKLPADKSSYTWTAFGTQGGGNYVGFINDGTKRIQNSNSGYNIDENTYGGFQEEFFASMTNTTFDGLNYFWDSNHSLRTLQR